MQINGMKDAVGCISKPFVCSWRVEDAQGKHARSCTVEILCDEEIVYRRKGALNALGEELEFSPRPHEAYTVRVSVTDDAGDRGSGECVFIAGKENEPWRAKWIGMQAGDSFHPFFRKQFYIGKKPSRAQLCIAGLGLFVAFLNGKRVGDDRLAPFINDYESGIQCCVYEIADLLAENSENEFNVMLGNGWYKGRLGFDGQGQRTDREFQLIAELHFPKGEYPTIGSDTSWKYRKSCVQFSDIYDGEERDDTADLGEWRPACEREAQHALCSRYSLPLCEQERLPVQQLIVTPRGEHVLDFGQNFAGYVEINAPLARGQKVTLEFGEILQEGCFYRDNYRTARSRYVYTSDGQNKPIVPLFTFFGFRYVKVSGMDALKKENFTGIALYSKMRRTGYLETSDTRIDRLYENSVWGMLSNFLDMPTDCPQRDERLGWTGDAQVFAPTASFHMDTKAFYAKFLRDLGADAARHAGAVALFLPRMSPLTASVWGDSATLMPATLYEYFGDKVLLKEEYPLMKGWVDYIRSEDERRGARNLYDFGFQFGDWLALDGVSEQSSLGGTDEGFISSCYYHCSAQLVANAAKTLGYSAEAKEYAALSHRIKKAILREYFSPSGRLCVDTQTGHLIALRFGIWLDKDKLISGLLKRFERDGMRIKGGFVGATCMNCVLAEVGLSRLAYDFLFYDGFPSWLYAVDLGATTIWERWNSVLSDGKISGTGMNSLNHYAYGSVVEFLYRYAAGIRQTAPGFTRCIIAPLPDSRLRHLKCIYYSAAGKIVSEWYVQSDGKLSVHVEIPFGARARILLPYGGGEHEVKKGSYDYCYVPTRDLRVRFDGQTPFEFILKDKVARALVEKFAPDVLQDASLHTLTPERLKKRLATFGADSARIDALVEALRKLDIDLMKKEK